jgi:hypothetical protein
MAVDVKLLDAVREDISDAIVAYAGTGATIKIYTGTKPAGPATGLGAQVLLGTLTIAGTFGTYSAGVLTIGTITSDSSADATGAATWFRAATSGGTAFYDGTVGTSASDLVLNTTSIVTGGPIAITAFTLTMPGG